MHETLSLALGKTSWRQGEGTSIIHRDVERSNRPSWPILNLWEFDQGVRDLETKFVDPRKAVIPRESSAGLTEELALGAVLPGNYREGSSPSERAVTNGRQTTKDLDCT